MDTQLENIIAETIKNVVGERNAACRGISLSLAKKLISAVEEKAAEMGVNAVVAVSTQEGNPIAVECMDGSFIASYDIAVNKAYTSAALKISTKQLGALASPGGSLYGIQFTNQGKIVIFGGGEPLKTADGRVVGGLGVSGGTEEQDTALGEYGRRLFKQSF